MNEQYKNSSKHGYLWVNNTFRPYKKIDGVVYYSEDIYDIAAHVACFSNAGRTKILRRNNDTMAIDGRNILHYPGENIEGYFVSEKYIELTQKEGIPLKQTHPFDLWRNK